MSKCSKYLIVHGHFYQPPRENPWLGEVEIQPSAHPDHDWNDRILKQCYEPNGCSRVLNAYGRVEDLVNNYEYLSFNFGPTLLNWIETKHPRTYQRIVQADKASVKKLGYGNAIAQVFNHIIMPLANRRDRLTQIRWGVQDFQRHFGRKPDCIWLAETAINNETVADLIQEGIRFVILAPSQAGAIRPMGTEHWHDVSHSNVDGTRTYRIFPKDGAGKPLCEGHLDAFFYHDGLSRAVSFERVLNDAAVFGQRIKESFDQRSEDQVVTIATDGESYGHHHAYGDMCLAYLFKNQLSQGEIQVVNPAWYLHHHQPTWEVSLKNGTGEGTAWSCAHGVGRWYRDCSCSTGAAEGWNQKWRTPLRESLNELRDQLDQIFVAEATNLSSKSPWDLRDAYIHVIGKQGKPEVAQTFCQQYLSKNTPENSTRLLQLLEMQKFMQYSFTSCGWFFNDFEGIEPLQNLKYARSAIDFAREIVPNHQIEENFLRNLREAISNQTHRHGDEIYREHIDSSIPLEHRIVAAAIFNAGFSTHSFTRDLGNWEICASVKNSTERHILWQLDLWNKNLLKRSIHHVLTLRSRFHEDLIVVFPQGQKANSIKVPNEIFPTRREVAEFFGNASVLAVSDLLPDHLMSILDDKARSSFESMSAEFHDFPKRYNLFYDLIAQSQVVVPEWISTPIRLSLNAEINDLLRQLLNSTQSAERLPQLIQALEHAHRLGIEINVSWIQSEYSEALEELLADIVENHQTTKVDHLLDLITIADRSKMAINRLELENLAFPLFIKLKSGKIDKVAEAIKPVLIWLNYAV